MRTIALSLVLAGVAHAQFAVSVDPSGCRVERVAFGEGKSYHQFHGVSPDGRKLAVGWETIAPDPVSRGAFLIDLQTAAREDLPALNNAASFSPDGRKVVSGFQTGSPGLRTEIVEYDLATHQLTFLAPDPQGDWLPTYSHDGRSVIFNSYRTGGSDLYRLDRETRAVEALTNDPRYEAHAQLSLDDRRIAFHRQIKDNDYAVQILDLATRDVTSIADTPSEEAYPAWSPDGRMLVFSSTRGNADGETDLYIATTDGTIVRRLTSAPGRDTYADWSADGRYIYFNSSRGRERGTDVYRIEMRGDDCRRAP